VLTGVSVAVIQYLFTNHQAHLKDFITSLVKIDFDKNNQSTIKLGNSSKFEAIFKLPLDCW
jgi:hypothetical protein